MHPVYSLAQPRFSHMYLVGHLELQSFLGTSEDQAFQIPTSEKCSFGLVHGQFLPFSVVVHLPNFGSQCEEPCENYKIQK